LLEGKYRPGHFQGVCQVVERLLKIVQPHTLYLGQKDYQQCMVIQKLVEQVSLPVEIVKVATLREDSGLAMSSRNTRLNDQEKILASHIFKALQSIKEQYHLLAPPILQDETAKYLLANGFTKVDYVAIANASTLQPITDNKEKNAVALIAAFINNVRLIDNMLLSD
jgi:pantoate--beta-alanine ligase